MEPLRCRFFYARLQLLYSPFGLHDQVFLVDGSGEADDHLHDVAFIAETFPNPDRSFLYL